MSNISSTAVPSAQHYDPYQSPDTKLSSAARPRTIKSLLPKCREEFLRNPYVNATVMKMAEYPLTDLVIEEDDMEVRERWTGLLNEEMQLPVFEKLMSIDYFSQGNSFVIPRLKIRKNLICKTCKKTYDIEDSAFDKHWKFSQFKYILKCPSCGSRGEAQVSDQYLRSPRNIELVRYQPELVTIYHGYGFTDPVYALELPNNLKRDIKLGRKHVIKTIPHEFVEALRKKKQIIMNHRQIYHMRRPNVSHPDYGWGLPLPYPVLDDIYYLKMLRKAQEAIAAQHILPFNILYPSSNNPQTDISTFADLGTWREKALDELAQWRRDPNYIAVMPTPMGHQAIGGTGRALMLHQEQAMVGEEIIAGMGVPLEFVKGGLQWSGTDVSLKSLANQFVGLVSGLNKFLNSFLIPYVSSALRWQRVRVHHKRFRMASDLQRSMMLFQMAQAGKVSDTTMLEESELDPILEVKRLKEENARQVSTMREAQKAHARTQGEVQVITARYQAKANQIMMDAQGQQQMMAPGQEQPPEQGQEGQPQAQQQVDPQMMAQQLAQQLHGQDANTQKQMLDQLSATHPQVANYLRLQVLQGGGSKGDSTAKQKPPRSEQAAQQG
jgi:hypothetical protein